MPDEETLGCAGAIVYIALGLAEWVWGGIVIVKLWYWFAVPIGLPVIGITMALGLSLLVHLFTYDLPPDSEPFTLSRAIQILWVGALRPTIALAFGYLLMRVSQ